MIKPMSFFWNKGLFLIAVHLALVIVLALGVFVGDIHSIQTDINSERWYFMNRGLPKIWSGVALAESAVLFPLVKVPFYKIHLESARFQRMIDLSVFVPMVLMMLLPSYVLVFMLKKATDENRGLRLFFLTGYLLFTLLSMGVFWVWISRV